MGGSLPPELQKLEEFFSSKAGDMDAMGLSELNGFLAGVIVCPELIMPSDWLPLVWGEEGPVFDNEDEARSILELVMGHYNEVQRQLDQGNFQPIYDADEKDEIVWEIWVAGFMRAMHLRPEAWIGFAKNDDEALQRSLFVLGRLSDLALDSDDLESMEIDEALRDSAPDFIPIHVELLHQVRLALADPFAGPATNRVVKAGRNDPCPCGSGKKFKKCCLN